MLRMIQRKKGKYKADFKVEDFYQFYMKSLDSVEKKTGYNVSESKFRSCLTKGYKAMMDLIFNNEKVILPSRQGTLRIRSITVTNTAVDWKTTMELRKQDPEFAKTQKKIKFLNEHTDNKIYVFEWDKFNMNVKNKTAYCFIATRANKRQLAKILKQEDRKMDYYG